MKAASWPAFGIGTTFRYRKSAIDQTLAWFTMGPS